MPALRFYLQIKYRAVFWQGLCAASLGGCVQLSRRKCSGTHKLSGLAIMYDHVILSRVIISLDAQNGHLTQP
jgi:hypothetical protein